MRVPLAPGWPTAQEWRDGQFDVIDEHGFLTVRARLPRLAFLGHQNDLFDDVFLAVPCRSDGRVRGDPALVQALHMPTYTGEGQREAVRALFHLPPADTLIANLPTGSGKSVLAQLPSLLGGEGSITLGIVPTVALALDQARRLEPWLKSKRDVHELPPLAYHGGLTLEQRQAVWRSVRSGTQPVLFTSPEHATGSLRPLLEEAAALGRLSHLVIDEAHLVVGWGNGFRPAFQLLPALVADLRRRAGQNAFRVVLASATLTAATTRTLRQLFGPPEATYVVAAVHLRPELRYSVQHFEDERPRIAAVIETLRLAPRPFILYVTRPDEATQWVSRLKQAGFERLDSFTGDTPPNERERLLGRWERNELDGMVATSAFGLGVDKSDVRFVLHATLPESLDRFYQEVGRAGRDGLAAASLVLYTHEDFGRARDMAGDKLIRDETGLERWQLMIDHAQEDAERPHVLWLDLRRLPAHLRQASEASAGWNIRTLTLMVRAGLIELVSLANGVESGKQDDDMLSRPCHAAVRILEDDHRDPKTFAERMQRAREQVWAASAEGFQAMSEAATGQREISDALVATYSFVGEGVWAPVTRCCGGCAVHWSDRRRHGVYSPPSAPRLQRFAHRPPLRETIRGLPMARENLLVIDISSDEAYLQRATQIAETILNSIVPHTVGVERTFYDQFRSSVERVLFGASALRTFIDRVDPDYPAQWRAGEGEVRLLVWGPDATKPVPADLWASPAALEILVIPTRTWHPSSPGRRLVDTTPHVHADDLLNRMYA